MPEPITALCCRVMNCRLEATHFGAFAGGVCLPHAEEMNGRHAAPVAKPREQTAGPAVRRANAKWRKPTDDKLLD